ncbi:AMP-binding protein [Nocardia carnea]|uniref:AMP-binding protein n=1 Tax=Nocardia carnea TaxID=37328 RepID=UPI0024551435|nr:AMP-binding protein [Nocardia carnea]
MYSKMMPSPSSISAAEAVAAAHGNDIVASADGLDLTSAELDRWSNRMARMLLRLGAGPGNHVALAAVPEFEMIVIRHALAKIGATARQVTAEVFAPAATVGVTVRARRDGLSDSTRWLVLDERVTLQQYLSTSSDPLEVVELGSERIAS